MSVNRKRRRVGPTSSSDSSGSQPQSIDLHPQTDEHEQMMKRFQEMREAGILCDVTFCVRGVDFLVHKSLVAATSSVLGAMLRSGMMESTMSIIHFTEDDPHLFHVMIDYLYGLKVEICSSQCIGLLGLVNKYQVEGLKTQICDSLSSILTANNCCSIFAASDMYSCPALRDQAITKLFNNFASASKSDGFNELSLTHILEVLSSDRVLDCDEAVVFEAAVRWLQHNHSARLPYRLDVLSVVRFPLMDAGYLSEVIKPHLMMQAPDTHPLLLEAFEHHALRASGRDGLDSKRTVGRRRSCSFSPSTLLSGHTDGVSALLVVYSASPTPIPTLVSGSWDSTIRVWNTETWRCERTLSDHTGTIRGLCECQGKVVSCSEDCTIKVWNPDGWSLVRTLTGHSESVNCLCVCMGRLASAGDDGAIKLWNTQTWQVEVTVHHAPPPVNSDEEEDAQPQTQACVMSIVLCGEKLVSASDDAQIKVWNTHNWTCEHVLRAHEDEVWTMMVTEHQKLVSGSVNGTLRVWDPDSWTCQHLLANHMGPVYAMSLMDGKLVSAGDTQILVWDSDWTLERRLSANGVWSLAVCRGKLVSGGVDASIKVWT